MNQAVIIIVVTAIGLLLGLLIYLANARLPYKARGIEKIEAINRALPGTDCGACGNGRAVLFKKGEKIGTIIEKDFVEALMREVERF